MIQIHKRTKVVVIPKSREGIHRLQQTHTLEDKQTQQRVPLHLLPMGQMYQLTQLPLLPFRQCLKMFVALVLVAVCLPWALAYLVANM